MISINNLSVHFTGDYLFENVSFLINDRDRIGLVGRNGTGKTTLLKVLCGEMEPETGTIASPSGNTVGYLPQEMASGSKLSVIEETMTAFEEALKLQDQITNYTAELAERTDYHSESYEKLLHRFNDVNDRFHLIGGHMMQEGAEKVLKGLGFEPEDFNRPMSTFSGGWQMRVELAKILLRSPDVILLDEPTNHLDIESIQWLEDFLINYRGAVVLVSHDRTFLDNVTTRTVEIMNARIYDYKAGYSEYVELRAGQMEQQKAAFDNQQSQIAQIERFIDRFRYKSTKARQVQSRVKLLEKMDRVEVDDIDSSAIHFVFPPAPRSGKVVIEARQLSKKYGEKQVLKNLEYIIEQGDFVAFVGRNGEGKTTLARIIIGNLDHEGICRLGHNVVIGYYAQNQAELLDPEKTVFQTIDDVAVGDMRPKVRAILGSFLFGSEAIDKKVKVLSGGEKARLALARLLLKPVNLLVLDEPTNHLDMISKDILKNALLKFDGTLIVVSHDRDFLQGLTDKVFEFKNKGIKVWLGDVFDFLQARKLASLKELEARKLAARPLEGDSASSDNKLNYERRKQQDKEVRKVASKVEKVESEISNIESEIKKHDLLLADPESHINALKSSILYKEYQELKSRLEGKMEEWASLHDEMELLKKSQEG
ncbi:MAG: ABC-F family ATP-binding cassette domain-containing protein [Bacteroidales bacterium]|nr:ABC-F family ATP-binding cassette domain-containing protein [Bacteroidales bacterium]